MIMGFHEYAYQDREYIIRTMNTMHAHSACNQTLYSGFPAPDCKCNCTLRSEHICDKVA